ncbi:MAG TPA: phosphoribosylanthranilate isomerase [Lacipirellulaceae bacterium]|nr:phosphoribosylanthranilate isomerase [Lacipirellulaceae bacterium]
MFRVKICGVTNVADARVALDAGADAIGLNFYALSPRCVTVAQAKEIGSVVGGAVQRVGVFVNHSTQDMERAGHEAGLAWLQLHGDEPPADVARVDPRFNVVRVRRLDHPVPHAIAADLQACRAAGRVPAALMVDAAAAGQYGGSGVKVDWAALADSTQWLDELPLILAGGLTPDNVAEAIRIVRPAAVDVASGVEASPGRKDPAKVRDFVANALAAFMSLGGL